MANGTEDMRRRTQVGRRVFHGALSRLEPGAGKLARRVLREGVDRKVRPLPDHSLEWSEIIIFVPIFLPMLSHCEVDPLFFRVLVALNLQTSFLTPPMAMAACYLNGVAGDRVLLLLLFFWLFRTDFSETSYKHLALACLEFMANSH